MCMRVLGYMNLGAPHTCIFHHRQGEGTRYPDSGVSGDFSVTGYRYWEWNMAPLQELYILLAAEPFSQFP